MSIADFNTSGTAIRRLTLKYRPSAFIGKLVGQPNVPTQFTKANSDQLGVNFREYHDFGCDRAESLTAVKVKNAA